MFALISLRGSCGLNGPVRREIPRQFILLAQRLGFLWRTEVSASLFSIRPTSLSVVNGVDSITRAARLPSFEHWRGHWAINSFRHPDTDGIGVLKVKLILIRSCAKTNTTNILCGFLQHIGMRMHPPPIYILYSRYRTPKCRQTRHTPHSPYLVLPFLCLVLPHHHESSSSPRACAHVFAIAIVSDTVFQTAITPSQSSPTHPPPQPQHTFTSLTYDGATFGSVKNACPSSNKKTLSRSSRSGRSSNPSVSPFFPHAHIHINTNPTMNPACTTPLLILRAFYTSTCVCFLSVYVTTMAARLHAFCNRAMFTKFNAQLAGAISTTNDARRRGRNAASRKGNCFGGGVFGGGPTNVRLLYLTRPPS